MSSAQLSARAQGPAAPQRPELTEKHRQLILAAAAELIAASLHRRRGQFADPTLDGAAAHLVSGAFVCLKRRGHLRSCCGLLGQPLPLAAALQEAAVRTAWEDLRFPPVSPTELVYLDLEVWILYGPEPITLQGEERVQAVTIGKHGLQVVQGQARGLLLPGVAVENGWDALRFLEQVCVKAGLHPGAWKNDAAALYTFEGESIQGSAAPAEDGRPTAQPPRFRPEEMTALANFCRNNIAALLAGATPNYYLAGGPDGTVNGLVLTVRRPGANQSMDAGQMSMRPGLPLQATLYSLAQAAAQGLGSQGIQPQHLTGLEVGLTVFYDPAMHGTIADPDFGGVDVQRRALAVFERSKSGILFDPGQKPDELLREAVKLAQVRNRAGTPVFSLEAVSSMNRLAFSTVPRAVRGPAIRPPAVAGGFYPADPAELSRMLDELLAGESSPEEWGAAMVPHAGLVYSGRIAARVFQRLRIPRTVIVIGPKHTALGTEWAVAPQRTWALPGGTMGSDFILARQLSQAIAGLELDALAHQREHAIEVELPFLARLAPETRVIGIAIGGGDLDSCKRFAEGLAGVLRQREDRPLLVVSSDMNHYASDSETRRLDSLALEALDSLDPEQLYKTVTTNGISMCGVLPAVIVLQTLRLLDGLKKSERVGYATSGDVTGDRDRVVGYAGMLFR